MIPEYWNEALHEARLRGRIRRSLRWHSFDLSAARAIHRRGIGHSHDRGDRSQCIARTASSTSMKGQGVEYSFAVAVAVAVVVMALVPATLGVGSCSLDNYWLHRTWSFTTGLLFTRIFGVVAAVMQLAVFY